ncbi:tyrosine-protein phosphatase [Shewanella gaetbuli]|uniref:protein-tyrosine-phosphatase n=1 Tax=Shewanella gaetbuli TaxID=220752 RepID=A0A9X1ZK64_9GAMM|nr:CpsB/CapC family capsule biosynthesis tyrosine phosphatase [Shewanella gaetbuli]MCL1143243.1 capsule biosynthesis protein CapC [Shewanella gaetbuli]
MIDLHCHILPNIDDGAKSIDEALTLIELAQQQGVTRMVATPHIHLGIFDNDLAKITAAYQLLQANLPADNKVDIRAAAEVRICPEIMMLAEQGKLPFIGQYDNKNVLLLELPSSHILPGTDKLINWLKQQDIICMIAHPERNRELQAHPDRINPFVKQGCLFQLTAASLLGDMGEKPLALSQQWISQQLYSIIASDCHSIKRRPPKLQQAFDITEQRVNSEYAEKLLYSTPKRISDALFEAAI